ncbi:hypothetical protein CRM22_006955 [Opisthorchis felineus]|uniref:Fibronectin type-III domain-containing protein n=1 Tax=Opisthorchis felineus TaxID=147828 RepID=A0A4S2LIT5_OPIFE|nr:hypothetical protein CRM22_006955 [Opisthorchis felineus]
MMLWCLTWFIALYVSEHYNVLAFVELNEPKYITDEVMPIDEPILEFPDINKDDICASMDRRITVRPIESGENYVNVKWGKVQPGNTVRVTVLGVMPAFKQSVGTEIRVGGLDACTNYNVSVELLNGHEVIESKQPTEVMTSYPALNAPENFDIKSLSSVFGHKLTWAPMTSKYPSTCRLSYRVEREARKGEEVEKHSFALNETKLEIADIANGVEYSYKVQGVFNLVHGGKFSDPLKITALSRPPEPVKPVVTWTDMELKVDWTGKLDLSEQIQQVHLLYNEDGIPKKRIAKQADGHLFIDIPTSHLDCNMLFAVENHAGISPFTTVPIPARHPLPVPQNLQIKSFKNTLVHSVAWSPVSPDCDITYVLQTEVMNSGGEITQFNTETKQTEITFKDINPLNFYRYSVKTRNGNSEAGDFSLPRLLEMKGAIPDKLSFEVKRIDDNAATINWVGALHRLSYARELVLVITGGEIPTVINEKVETMQHYAELPIVQGDITFYAASQNPSGLSAFQKVAVLKRKKKN